jgi:5-methylthioadenosine/S-adenosylhomocysteine deaminase
VGKKADLILFDLDQPVHGPAGTPAQQLVWAASSRDLVHTLVEGEFLVRDRRPTRLDAAEVLKNARQEARKLVGRAGLEGKIRV